jgi:hypothetical protein
MSFVIGKSFGDNILLLADTFTTDLRGERTELTDHVAKLVSIGPPLCVAFAGRNEPAGEAIRSFNPPSAPWVRYTINHFLNAHRRASFETEFILGLGHPIYRLVEIKDGRARLTACDSFAWLGCQAARERFQRDWSQRTPLKGFGDGVRVQNLRSLGRNQTEFDRMYQAMEHVMGASIPSVGGFIMGIAGYPLAKQLTSKENGASRTDKFLGLVYAERFEIRTEGPKFALEKMEPIIMGQGVDIGSYAQWTMCGFTPSC